jgi:hypothetical protein
MAASLATIAIIVNLYPIPFPSIDDTHCQYLNVTVRGNNPQSISEHDFGIRD